MIQNALFHIKKAAFAECIRANAAFQGKLYSFKSGETTHIDMRNIPRQFRQSKLN